MSAISFPDNSVHESLPSSITPLHYKVHLFDLDVKKNTFNGLTTIQFAVNSATTSVILHQKFLNFQSAKAVSHVTKTNAEVPVNQITKNDEKETVEFKLESPVSKGQLDLEIRYSGKIRTDMTGFYTSHYETEKGDTEYILVTQFESADARSAFPCYDEPNRKATFDISLTVEKDVTALSNMPVLSSKTLDSGKKGPGFDRPLKCVTFETTPKMSTYLVAWSVGKFDYVETHTKNSYRGKPLPVRVYTIPGQSKTGQFALSVARKDVDYLSKIFDVEYPLPKLDLLAVPQFGANAMENWGMVTFRATALLYDEDKSDVSYQQNVAYVVSHEIAHSWFGNYVTMNWWSDLWLNESFATFVGSLCVEDMHPEWKTFTDFVTNGVEVALDLDSLENSHPIEVRVNTAAEIDQIFDHISYLKGGSIIRMVASTVGVDVFLKGVSNYLKKHSFGNAKSDDLWDEVAAVSGKDITKLIAPWIRAVGYPYVSVENTSEHKIKVAQHRFILGREATADEDKVLWWIPNISALTDVRTATIAADNFVKLNKDTVGFYRVFYEESLFDNIVANLSGLSAEDKIGLVADTAAAAQTGYLKTSALLKLFEALKDEEDVNVWIEIIKRLDTLKLIFFSDAEVLEKLNNFSRKLFKSKFSQLFAEPTEKLTFPQSKLRSLLFSESGSVGVPETIAAAQKLFHEGSIEPSLRLPVFQTLLANKETCTREVFDYVLNEVKHPSSIDSTEIALKALGSISNTDLFLDDILGLYFSKYVLEMDYMFLTIALVKNPNTKAKFWKFFEGNYPRFRSDVAMWTLDRLIKNLLPRLVSRELAIEIQSFFADKDTTGYTKGLHQGLDSIKSSLIWTQGSRSDVLGWLSANEQ
ncbi:DEKNAAC100395 [Brettanomyces naardenensis]|uniref:Aminopeptidase n=1 Tax=Brettanomyces naardenensis TaxID=13370 RepID=A0A448YEX3_BRENA|nr:DEKNAAC100395 [Brettanomyces naardenensis]